MTMSSSMQGEETSSPRQCIKCAKDESSLETPLKWCAKCKGSFYCSRGCQQQDRKVHKKICSKQAAQAAQNSSKIAQSENESISYVRSNDDFVSELRRRLGLGEVVAASDTAGSPSLLDSIPCNTAYKVLIDAYRFRVEEEYTQTGDVSTDSLYGGGDPHAGFKRFLNKAETKSALPSWWCPAKRKECEKLSRPLVACAIEKADLKDAYPDRPLMAMELRALAEKVYGPIKGY